MERRGGTTRGKAGRLERRNLRFSKRARRLQESKQRVSPLYTMWMMVSG
jgi:hypothetical protein